MANLVAFWREQTFQALAITLLGIAGWLAACEIIASGSITAISPAWADVLSPLRAVWSLCQPIRSNNWLTGAGGVVAVHCFVGLAAFALFSLVAIWRLQAWNPSQQVRLQTPEPDEDYATDRVAINEATATWKVRAPRPMWDNPVLWREIRTWA